MGKMNDVIAEQCLSVMRAGGDLTDFFREKGINRNTGYAYMCRYKSKLKRKAR